MPWSVYILECADGTLYTGISPNIEQRIQAHNSGKGAKYTRTRLPVKMLYQEMQLSRSDAAKREWQIKQLTRSEKLKLITA